MSLMQMSVLGGELILLIVVVRSLALHRLPKAAFLVLWEVATLRLLLPFSVRLPFGFPTPIKHLAVAGEYLTAAVPTKPVSTGMPSAVPTPESAATHSVLPVIWPVGFTLMAVYFTVCYVRAMRKFGLSCPDNTPAVQTWLAGRNLRRPLEVRQSDLVFSPLTYGILRPVILLPKDMERNDETTLTYILTHEFIHIRRFDAVTKLLFATVLCVHWFNPLAWVMYALANRDLELSCDECVMDTLGSKEKAPYALTLIAMKEAQSQYLSIYNHFSKLAIEERIEAIMKYKKASMLAIALTVALVLGATTAFAATNAQTSSPASQPFGSFITDEDGNSIPISNSQVVRAPRFAVDKDGNCTPNPDEDLNALLDALEIPERQFNQDGDVTYKFISKDQGGLDMDMSSFQPTRTEEEWQQIIADIESGKIPPFEIPDDPNITVSFVDYVNGNCVAN